MLLSVGSDNYLIVLALYFHVYLDYIRLADRSGQWPGKAISTTELLLDSLETRYICMSIQPI